MYAAKIVSMSSNSLYGYNIFVCFVVVVVVVVVVFVCFLSGM